MKSKARRKPSVRRKRTVRRRRRKPEVRQKHTARATVQVQELSKAGTSIDIEIYKEEEKIGTLVIGRGSVTWRGGKWKHGRRFSWSRFAALMDEGDTGWID
jgi:hypothetical protein